MHPAIPRTDGDREALRILLVARERANTTRTAAVNVFKALLLTAPDRRVGGGDLTRRPPQIRT